MRSVRVSVPSIFQPVVSTAPPDLREVLSASVHAMAISSGPALICGSLDRAGGGEGAALAPCAPAGGLARAPRSVGFASTEDLCRREELLYSEPGVPGVGEASRVPGGGPPGVPGAAISCVPGAV